MSNQSSSLQITRRLKHDRARVFSALTDPVKMGQWFFGTPGGAAKVSNDLRPGGGYRIEMMGAGDCTPQGTYLEIAPPEKLVFTWVPCKTGGLTKVTVELFEDGAGTKLVLTHELPEDEVAGHREGWNICFDHLELYLDGKPAVAARAQKS